MGFGLFLLPLFIYLFLFFFNDVCFWVIGYGKLRCKKGFIYDLFNPVLLWVLLNLYVFYLLIFPLLLVGLVICFYQVVFILRVLFSCGIYGFFLNPAFFRLGQRADCGVWLPLGNLLPWSHGLFMLEFGCCAMFCFSLSLCCCFSFLLHLVSIIMKLLLLFVRVREWGVGFRFHIPCTTTPFEWILYLFSSFIGNIT